MQRLRALLVEDSEDDALLIARELRKGGYELFFQRVDTLPAMAMALKQHTWDIVISDHSMPSFSAPAALALLKERSLDVPFIIVSGCIGEDVAVAAMKAGAHDFMLKDNLARLVPVVQREIREAQERRSRTFAEEAKKEFEARTQAILENAADGIVILGDDSLIESFNAAASSLFGYDQDEVIGKPFSLLLADREDECVRDLVGSRAREMQGLHKDESTFPIEVSVSEVRFQQKGIYTVFIRDVTERYVANQNIREQVERLEALRMIELAINSSLDISLTLSVIIDQALTQLHADAADVLLLDSHTQTLNYAAGKGFRSKMITKSHVRMGEDHAGRAALERSVVRYNPIRDKPEGSRIATFTEEAIVDCCVMPLVAKGQVKGVIEVFNRSRMKADDGWIDFFELLASQAALAIDNATMFDRLQRTNVELALAYDSTLEGWSKALDLRDKETEGHTERVAEATMKLARQLGVPEDELVHARRGALLHDIGKMGIPDAILLKPGPLTDDEWEVMRKHPVYAFEWLSPISFLRAALDIPYCHHEKWDGSGYPRKISGEQIPMAARVFAVIDVWDALCSDRPYRKAWPKDKVRDHVAQASGTHFDPEVATAFLDSDW
jgi:PAS domain S-box-containing protein/putative nucleotidyltransferase with HDIG domain